MGGRVYPFQTDNPLTILAFFADVGNGLFYGSRASSPGARASSRGPPSSSAPPTSPGPGSSTSSSPWTRTTSGAGKKTMIFESHLLSMVVYAFFVSLVLALIRRHGQEDPHPLRSDALRRHDGRGPGLRLVHVPVHQTIIVAVPGLGKRAAPRHDRALSRLETVPEAILGPLRRHPSRSRTATSTSSPGRADRARRPSSRRSSGRPCQPKARSSSTASTSSRSPIPTSTPLRRRWASSSRTSG